MFPGERLGELGAAWNKADNLFKKSFMSPALHRPDVSSRQVSASAGIVKGSKDKSLAMIWNPDDLSIAA